MSRRLIVIVFLAALAALAGWRLHAGQCPAEVERSRVLMGTVVEITAFGNGRSTVDRAVTAAFDEMGRIDALMGPHGSKSDAVRLSGSATLVAVNPETAAVIAEGLQVATQSGGAFDMGLGRLKKLWGIETDHPRVPTPAEIRRALTGTGPGDLALSSDQVRKRAAAVEVDLGGIAKGYAIDRAVAVLRAAGIRHAAVNAGGDIRLIGDRLGRPWRIGIEHPRDPQKMLAALDLSDLSVVTSGDYERYFIRNGIRYHHIFDPRTGSPARGCQSVTVVAADATRADALATAAFVLGPAKGLALLERLPGVEGLLVDSHGKVTMTTGLKGKVRWP